jgi:hypothetical protein
LTLNGATLRRELVFQPQDSEASERP